MSIKRGSDPAVEGISACVGSTQAESDDGEGFKIDSSIRDFIFSVADYDFGAGAVEPERGDEIRQTIGSSVYVWTVMPVGGEKPWRFCDGYGDGLRVHTRLTGIE